MKYIAILLMASCSAIPPNRPDGNNCGVIAGGDWDTK